MVLSQLSFEQLAQDCLIREADQELDSIYRKKSGQSKVHF